MYAMIDPDCIGCGQCAALCPAVFSLSGACACALCEDIADEDVPAASAARDMCPVCAIDLCYD